MLCPLKSRGSLKGFSHLQILQIKTLQMRDQIKPMQYFIYSGVCLFPGVPLNVFPFKWHGQKISLVNGHNNHVLDYPVQIKPLLQIIPYN